MSDDTCSTCRDPACQCRPAALALVAAPERNYSAEVTAFVAAFRDCQERSFIGRHVASLPVIARPFSDEERAALEAAADGLPPLAIAAMTRLCAHGGAKHGCSPGESKPGVTVADHVGAAERHLAAAVRLEVVPSTYGKRSVGFALLDYAARDEETGELHLSQAMTRLALAVEMMEATRGR